MAKFKLTVKGRTTKGLSFEALIEASDKKDALHKFRAIMRLPDVTVDPVEDKRSTLRISA